MNIRALTELFTQEIWSLHRAEQQIIPSLEATFEAASSSELQDALATHLEETKEHLSRLKSLIMDYPETIRGNECEALAGMIAEIDEVAEREPDAILQDLGLIAICQRIKHYKIATYGCARNYARRLGDDGAVELLSLTIEEEVGADRILTNIAEELLEEVEDSLAAVA